MQEPPRSPTLNQHATANGGVVLTVSSVDSPRGSLAVCETETDGLNGETDGKDFDMTSRLARRAPLSHGASIFDVHEALNGKKSSPSTIMYRGFLDQARFLSYVVAVLGSLLMYGLLQERVMTEPYELTKSAQGSREPPVADYFGNSLFLVFQNRLFALVIAVALGILLDTNTFRVSAHDYDHVGNGSGMDPSGPHRYSSGLSGGRAFKYFLVSFSNIVATNCQYEALKYVSFPTQTLFKCGKMIPVMVFSTCLSKKSYRVLDYGVAVIVGVGCFSFAVTGNIASKKSVAMTVSSSDNTWFGILLMITYLFADSLTSTMQEHLFQDDGETLNRQMMFVNLSSCMLTIGVMLVRGTFFSSFQFFRDHPKAIWETSFLSLAAVASQYAITGCVFAFGSLTYVTIMTVRQIVSVVLSNLVFGHQLGMTQWVCIVTVFGALLLRSYFGKSARKTTAEVGQGQNGSDSRV